MPVDSPDDQERDRGVISQSDRQFLQKSEEERQEDYTRQGRADAWSRILERTRNALLDFALLHDRLDADDRNEIFDYNRADLDHGIHGMIAFLWQHATDLPPYDQDANPIISPEEKLEQWLERGIYRAQTTNAPRVAGPAITIRPVDVDLEIENLEEISVEKINERLQNKSVEALSDNELQFFLWLGRREHVADDSFMGVDFDTVLAEFTDRLDDEWDLRGQFVLGRGAYADDAERDERAARRQQYQDTTDEDEKNPDVPPGGDPRTGRNTDEES